MCLYSYSQQAEYCRHGDVNKGNEKNMHFTHGDGDRAGKMNK